MADVSQVVTLGIGTPSDIAHLILAGLSPNTAVATPNIVRLTGTYAPTLTLTATYAPAVRLTGTYAPTLTLTGETED